MKTNRSIGEVVASLEAQASFHREREAFHAEHEAIHREHRTAHAAELAEILRRLEAFRSAAEAVDLADREGAVPSLSSLEEDGIDTLSRPRVHAMLEKVIAQKGADEPFGPVRLTGEVNRRFGQRLRRPVKAGQVSTALRRLERKGTIRLVREGKPHWEALYVRQAPEVRGEDAGDLEIINAHAAELNEEAADVLEYQSTPSLTRSSRDESARPARRSPPERR